MSLKKSTKESLKDVFEDVAEALARARAKGKLGTGKSKGAGENKEEKEFTMVNYFEAARRRAQASGEVSDSDEVTFNTAHWTKRDPEEVLVLRCRHCGHTWAAV